MLEQSIEKLKKLIEAREKREKYSGGELFVIWGILNISSVLIYQYAWANIWVWIGMIGVGILFQILYFRFREKKEGCILIWQKNVSQMWLIIVLMLPFLFFIYPGIFKIYPMLAIFPIVNFMMFFGLIMTGILLNHAKTSMFISGGFFFCASVLTAAFPAYYALFYSGAMLAGFVINGLLLSMVKRFR